MKLMSDNKVHHLPVVDESGHMSGFVGMMELMLSYIEPV
jgi:CBS-domain-containing membrane protein